MTPIDSKGYKAASKAVETIFGKVPIPVRGGGSERVAAGVGEAGGPWESPRAAGAVPRVRAALAARGGVPAGGHLRSRPPARCRRRASLRC